MSKESALQKIGNAYDKNPIIRALIQIAMSPIPYGIGGAIDATLTAKIQQMREKRLRTFFDELAAGSHALTESLIQEEDFLHAYFATLKAAVNTQRSEKIKLFARLLYNASREQRLSDDAYEEYLSVLEALSTRELHILLILKEFEDSHPHQLKSDGSSEMENDLQRASRFWGSFELDIEARYCIDRDRLAAILVRLNRTGLYETFTGGFLDYTGGVGKLTTMFDEFVHWIQATADDLAPANHA